MGRSYTIGDDEQSETESCRGTNGCERAPEQSLPEDLPTPLAGQEMCQIHYTMHMQRHGREVRA